jgi:hypothetical protein
VVAPVAPAARLVFAVTTDLNYDQRMQRVCGSLAQAGYEVELIGWQRNHSLLLTVQPYKQHRLRGWFQRGKLFYLEYTIRLFWYLLRRRADVWCCIDLDTALPVYARAWLGNQMFIYDAHELFTEVPEVVGRPSVQRIWQWVEDFIVPRTQLRYTVGPSLARLFEQRHPGYPFAMVRNVPMRLEDTDKPLGGMGEHLAAEAASTGAQALSTTHHAPPTPILLYQGVLNVGRGLVQLLDAMPLVPARLIMCGEGDCSAELRQQAQRLGLLATGQVEFRGYVLPAELRKLTTQATVGIMLLENTGLSYYYSLANKFFDYVQAGVPQLCIDFPEYRALNAQHEVAALVPDLAPATLVAELARLLPGGQPGTYHQRLAENCRRARADWNWQHEEKTLVGLYQKLLAASI